MEEPGFWDDPDRSTKLMKEAKNLKDTVNGFKALEQEYEDISVMIEMGPDVGRAGEQAGIPSDYHLIIR